jgi:hypothetical protein
MTQTADAPNAARAKNYVCSGAAGMNTKFNHILDNNQFYKLRLNIE